MSVFIQWVLLIVALTPLTYLIFKGNKISNKQFLAIFSFSILLLLFIDTKGTIGVNRSIDTLVNIIMWAIMIVTSTIFIFIRDIKRLAMVLFIPATVILFRLVEVIGSKINM